MSDRDLRPSPPGSRGLLGLGLGLLACAGPAGELETETTGLDAPRERVSLIDHSRWETYDEVEDPLLDHRPPDVECADAAWGVEAGALEVQTGVCNYFTVRQGALASLAPGDELHATLWFERLDAPTPVDAHVAILLDDVVIAERTLALPRDAEFVTLEATNERWVAAGAELTLHLHNHGFNSWSFVDIERAR